MKPYDTKRSTYSRRAIETRQLCKKYGATYALKDLSLHVSPGEIVGYLGPNGAGKTTTLRLLTGLAMPSDGQAFIAGIDCRSSNARGRLGVIPNDTSPWPHLNGGQVLELLAHLDNSVDRHYRSQLVKKFNLDLTKKCGAYSTGNRQKLLIVAALAKRPTVLICDEASTGLDPMMNRVFQEELSDAKNRGCGVLYSSHVLSEVEALADRVYLLAAGQVVDQGSVESLKGLTARTVILQGCHHAGPLAALPGVDHFEHVGDRCSFQFTGETNALLKALSTTPINAVSIQKPSLEEAFMSHYQETAQ